MGLILGIDEVGRGAWAGPLAVGAVILDSTLTPSGLADSKALSARQREQLMYDIKQSAISVGIGWVSAAQIDQIGLSPALHLATQRAYDQLAQTDIIDQIIIDGTIKLLDDARATTLIKADAKIAAVSAAAIVAKVARDHYMARLDQISPDFHFSKHVGYGTALHREALRQFGALDGIHRQSFAPVSGLQVKPPPKTTIRQRRGYASRELGYAAEDVAATFLKKQGHKIIVRNFKTRLYEIDIISLKQKTLYFTEVKFREKADFGDGLAAITPKKLAQMRRAAELFLAQRAEFAKDFDIRLSAIALSQNPPQVDEFIDTIS
jgi:ribonuclease HII